MHDWCIHKVGLLIFTAPARFNIDENYLILHIFIILMYYECIKKASLICIFFSVYIILYP